MDDASFLRWYGAWAVVRPEEVATLLGGFDRPWWVAGGWAVEAFTGVPREHDDIDVCIFRRDAAALREAVADRYTCWSAFDGALRPYDGEHDVHPDAVQLWLRPDAASPWHLDLLLNPDHDGLWVNRRRPEQRLPLDEVTWVREDGVRFLDPEVALLFKARQQRPKDDRDLEAALPLLSPAAVAWLRDGLLAVHPGHAWLDRPGLAGR